jgi:hypothetical protein
MFIAAMPVDAVIPRVGQPWPPSSFISSRKSTDFPVPADPEKKVLFPFFTCRRTDFCSSERETVVEVLASAFDELEAYAGTDVAGALDFNLAVRLYGF